MTSFSKLISEIGYDLKPHQIETYEWCKKQEMGFLGSDGRIKGGGLLCDDMGLGKTLMMISCICLNPKDFNLIVVPTILIQQWKKAVEKIAGIKPLIFHGAESKGKTLNDIKEYEVVITTYGMIGTRRGTGSRLCWSSPLWDIEWGRVIFDEVHHMRNAKSNSREGALKLKSDIKWLVSGTPIQNSWKDIISIMYLLPYPQAKLLFNNSKNYNIDEQLMFISEHSRGKTKKEVGINMPTMVDENVEVPFEGQEEEIAKDVHSIFHFAGVTKKQIHKMIKSMGESVLPFLTRAKQVCVCPSILNKCDIQDLEEKDKINFKSINHSKIKKVSEYVLKSKKENKKIIFCSFREEIEYYFHLFTKKGYKTGYIHGGVSQKNRNLLLTTSILDILIIQIKSGNEGLNLQQYNEIYFTSPHWNPAVEAQAVCRAYRIGQTKSVSVYKFYSTFKNNNELKTIDEYCLDIQKTKREVANWVKKV